MLREHGGDRTAVGEVALDEHGARMNRLAMPLVEVIEHDDVVPASHELLDGDAADVAGSARDEKFHALAPGRQWSEQLRSRAAAISGVMSR